MFKNIHAVHCNKFLAGFKRSETCNLVTPVLWEQQYTVLPHKKPFVLEKVTTLGTVQNILIFVWLFIWKNP